MLKHRDMIFCGFNIFVASMFLFVHLDGSQNVICNKECRKCFRPHWCSIMLGNQVGRTWQLVFSRLHRGEVVVVCGRCAYQNVPPVATIATRCTADAMPKYKTKSYKTETKNNSEFKHKFYLIECIVWQQANEQLINGLDINHDHMFSCLWSWYLYVLEFRCWCWAYDGFFLEMLKNNVFNLLESNFNF